ncbi:hypothetical protein SCHPADRAFT_902327 [Schizopora paradoxa]|uniref:F-box domain-containing protein n=1 Tax=Schizopora paradoxa TaxID=27342 RepID=A0A0H2SET4_9AGAM|nr:hypothetical protein SCHPADRAFT_902327 [Schizopora paradoxa]
MLILHEDILARIFLLLTLKEVVALRRVSRHLQHLISNDKILWEHILGCEVSARSLSLHPNRIDTRTASAAQVESWLRSAIVLRHSYSRTTRSTKSRLKLDQGITWVRIARARWCIVASSDVQQSRLSVYDFATNIKCCEVFYLSGPVLAGIVDDTDSGLRMALTVGSVKPQVVVLELGIVDGRIGIQHLATLEGYAFAIHFSGDHIVCAAKDGDDSHPRLLNWRYCRDWRLIPRVSEDEFQMEIQAHVNAIASTEWEDFIVVITNKSLQLFDATNLDGLLPDSDILKATTFFILEFGSRGDRNFVEEASFEIKTNRRARSGNPLLLFTGRRRDLHSFTGALLLEKGEGGERKLRLVEARVANYYDFTRNGDESDSTLCSPLSVAMRSTVGHSYGHVLQVVQSEGPEDRPVELLIVSWSKGVFDYPDEQRLSNLIVPAKVDNDGLPMLDFLTSIDFDDAAGLIAMGTSRGDVCFIRFLPDNSWATDALETSLPKLQNNGSTISKTPLPMELEEYYGYLQDVQAGTMPEALVAKVVGTWRPRYERGVLAPEWSQDWTNYDHIEEWISPWSGWLVSTFSFEKIQIGRGIVQTYRALGTKGIIVPVAYRVTPPGRSKDNEQILLRIGKRLYVVYVPNDEAEEIDIAALPVNFDNAFNSRMLKEFCSGGINWLQYWVGDGGRFGLGRSAEVAEEIFDFLKAHPQVSSTMEPEPEKWTNSVWDSLRDMLD